MAAESVFSYETLRQGEDNILKIDCEKVIRVPSIEDDELYMEKTIEFLIANPGTTADYLPCQRIFDKSHYFVQIGGRILLLKIQGGINGKPYRL